MATQVQAFNPGSSKWLQQIGDFSRKSRYLTRLISANLPRMVDHDIQDKRTSSLLSLSHRRVCINGERTLTLIQGTIRTACEPLQYLVRLWSRILHFKAPVCGFEISQEFCWIQWSVCNMQHSRDSQHWCAYSWFVCKAGLLVLSSRAMPQVRPGKVNLRFLRL